MNQYPEDKNWGLLRELVHRLERDPRPLLAILDRTTDREEAARMWDYARRNLDLPKDYSRWDFELDALFDGLLDGLRFRPQDQLQIFCELPTPPDPDLLLREHLAQLAGQEHYGMPIADQGHYFLFAPRPDLPLDPALRDPLRQAAERFQSRFLRLDQARPILLRDSAALPLAADCRAAHFHHLLCIQTDGSKLDALRTAFWLPDENPGPDWHPARPRSTPPLLTELAEDFLSLYTQQGPLREHLRGFLSRRNAHDLELTLDFVLHPDWIEALRIEDMTRDLPGTDLWTLRGLGFNPVLGWSRRTDQGILAGHF